MWKLLNMMKVAFSSVPMDDYGITTRILRESYMEWLMYVSHEMCEEHETLCQVIWSIETKHCC